MREKAHGGTWAGVTISGGRKKKLNTRIWKILSKISVEIIGFVITETLSLHAALYPLQTVQSG